MADANSDSHDDGEPLLRRLRRLTTHAESADANDRAKIIALIDDVDKLRRRLLRGCARVDEELRRAAVRSTAISAYARGGQSARAPHRRGH